MQRETDADDFLELESLDPVLAFCPNLVFDYLNTSSRDFCGRV